MRLWDKVYEVENFQVIVNDNVLVTTLYGNTRNCAAFTVYFEAKDSNNQIVDLSKEELRNGEVRLVYQDTGEELPREFGSDTADKLIYSTTKSKYSPGFTNSMPHGGSTAGKVTFYVYGKAKSKFIKKVIPKFVSSDGTVLKYDQNELNRQFGEFTVLPEISYGMSDIEPFNCIESARFDSYAVQWDFYIKLDQEKHPGSKWVQAEFENIVKLNAAHQQGDIFAMQNNDVYGYYYMLCPIGPEVEFDMKDSQDKFWMKVKYNKVPGALNMVLLRGYKSGSIAKPDALIKLYDEYGNEGTYILDWVNYLKDPTEPSIKATHWDLVKSVEDISVTVDGSKEVGTLFGNTRHCVEVIISFTGKDKNGEIVDLGEEKFSDNFVKLMDNESDKELPKELDVSRSIGIMYSNRSSIYRGLSMASNTDSKRAKVTFYVYGKAKSKIIKEVATKLFSCDGTELKWNQNDGSSQIARICVLPEKRYGMGDIEPVKWIESARFNNYAVQWDLYVKLNDKHPRNKWIHAEFDNPKKPNTSSHKETIFAEQNNSTYGYYYMLWPIGPEAEFDLLDSHEKFWMKVKYNKVHGALNMVLARGWKTSQESKPDVIIRLYDVFGNEGRFRVDWINYLEDPTGPSIRAIHWDLVNSVQDISFTVDGSTEIATLYGNTRHCVELTMSFTGKEDNGGIIDLSGDSFDSKIIKLVNQDTGNEISEKHDAPKVNDIYYSQQTSRFCLNLDNAYSSEVKPTGTYNTTSEKGKVTYYVYASAIQVFKIKIGAKFLFADGKTYSTADDNRTSKFAIVNVQPRREYTTADLEPFSYEQTAKESEWAVQWDAYIKLKNNVHWVYSEFDNYVKIGKQGYFATHYLPLGRGYYYFIWPVGEEGVYDLRTDYGNKWITVKYNKIPGAMNIVLIRGPDASINHGNAVIKLYDAYGNEGKFQFDWYNTLTDSSEPAIVNVNN